MSDCYGEPAWHVTSEELPPEGEVVEVLNGRELTTLVRKGNLWFFPDMSMYVYYTPRVWRRVGPADA